MIAFDRFFDIIKKLRSLEGCPWDREQTPLTMRTALVEETYELIEAIDEDDSIHIQEEIGDLLLVTSMIGYMYEQKSDFTLENSLNTVSDKLIRRHPHVFGDVKVQDSKEVLKNWNQIKEIVEGRKKNSIFDEIPLSLPPLERAYKIQKKASKKGFDWDNIKDVLEKVNEEILELKVEIEKENNQDNIENECGDLLFSVINLCRHLKCDPSIALARCNQKFKERFSFIENQLKIQGIDISDTDLKIMQKYWNLSKK